MTNRFVSRVSGRGDAKMLAQRRHEIARAAAFRPRRRRRANLVHALTHNRMACVLMLAAAVSFLLGVYVSAYARATESGYERTELLSYLRQVRLENESLRLQLEGLRQPDEIAAFALESSMEQGKKMAFLRPVKQPHVAQNTEHADIR